MHVEPFAMERWQSTYENAVERNLSESGVHPLRLADLVDGREMEHLVQLELGYPQTNGTAGLRERIAAMYAGASAGHVEVTNGGSEANFLVCWRFLDAQDEVVMMVPNYMQVRGLGRALAGALREWPLRRASDGGRWEVDLDELGRLVTGRTKLVLICNPNNPTGARFAAAELDEICRIAGRHGAWVVSDEIYRGAELDGRETASVWGRYERAIVTSGLSKAYGLPGLRIGWIVAPPDVIESTWACHDYTTIAPGAINDRLAWLALAPDTRMRILARTRGILRANLPVLTGWLDRRRDRYDYTLPEAGAIIYTRYLAPINSTALVTRLRDEESLLIVPGDQFGMDGYLRIGYGSERAYLEDGLARLDRLMATV